MEIPDGRVSETWSSSLSSLNCLVIKVAAYPEGKTWGISECVFI